MCAAFREKGHEAYSCDLQACSGGHPEWHIMGDALEALKGGEVVTSDGRTHEIGGWDIWLSDTSHAVRKLCTAGGSWYVLWTEAPDISEPVMISQIPDVYWRYII